MAPTEARSDTALVELALEFYRAPARFPGLRDPDQALPGDPAILLRLASGVPRDALGLSPALGTADVLREASRFFVQQVLLAPGADYYRMHGLGRDAGDDRIKENHRLLMRTFHPDRESGTQWQDGFASRINQAYGVLRDAAKRKDYDRVLAAGGDGAARTRRPTGGMRMRAWSDRELARGTPTTPFGRYVWRHLPQFVLGGVAIVAAGVVALVWWANQPSGAIGGDGGEVKSAHEPPPAMGATAVADAAPPAAQRSGQGERLVRSVDRPAVANREEAPAVAGSLRVEPPAGAGVSLGGAGDESARTASRTSWAPPATPLKADVVLNSPGSGRTLQEGSAQREPAAPQRPGPDSSTPVATAPHAPAAEAVDEPTRLIPELARRYAGGDLDAFMELFDANARNETGGYGKIRRDYDELFGTTAARQIYVWDMRWSPLGNHLWRGEGRFQARVQREGESAMRHYNGTLRIEVATQGERPLIRSLYHVLADGSR